MTDEYWGFLWQERGIAYAAYPGRLLAAEDSFAATSLATPIAMVSESLGSRCCLTLPSETVG
ncbi:hypothetical protein [Pseudoruegeria sp. SK021]|uniref:hypothetical protein n=1 Tax=Pseudoruegeria sp. SK021 TaxID=1933035 RepID=UPI000A221CCC|nr:hypothetical protein [Pseudoruegeria sp. SK021]OSP53585.1 hypothetical protein BV911_17120 [Pseudoruegeria sp. SK021]